MISRLLVLRVPQASFTGLWRRISTTSRLNCLRSPKPISAKPTASNPNEILLYHYEDSGILFSTLVSCLTLSMLVTVVVGALAAFLSYKEDKRSSKEEFDELLDVYGPSRSQKYIDLAIKYRHPIVATLFLVSLVPPFYALIRCRRYVCMVYVRPANSQVVFKTFNYIPARHNLVNLETHVSDITVKDGIASNDRFIRLRVASLNRELLVSKSGSIIRPEMFFSIISGGRLQTK